MRNAPYESTSLKNCMAETELWVRKNPLRSPQELQELGFKEVSYPTSLLYYSAQFLKDFLAEIKKKGLTEELVSRMMHFKDVTGLLGLPGYYEQEKKYL